MITKKFDPTVHDRDSFDCGEDNINNFIKTTAKQWTKKGLSTCWILESESDDSIGGFYTLSATSITSDAAVIAGVSGLPSEIPIPGVLISQLAVDRKYQGQKLGKFLLIDALKRSMQLGLGWTVIVVDALNDNVANWYESFGSLSANNFLDTISGVN